MEHEPRFVIIRFNNDALTGDNHKSCWAIALATLKLRVSRTISQEFCWQAITLARVCHSSETRYRWIFTDQYNIIDRLYTFYIELSDSERSTTIHTDSNKMSPWKGLLRE